MKPKLLLAPFLAALLALTGCGPRGSSGEKPQNGSAEAEEDEDLTPEEKAYLAAARPFLDAIARRDYAAAYALLSTHATARMSPNQFTHVQDEAAMKRQELEAIANAKPADFAKLMQRAEADFGTPLSVESAGVMTTDPAELAGKASAMETAFSIGNMPDSIPTSIRKASVRAQILTKLPPAELAKIAKDQGVTVEELQKDESFAPYCNLKVVLVEEAGALRVGYFEFTPPSMWD